MSFYVTRTLESLRSSTSSARAVDEVEDTVRVQCSVDAGSLPSWTWRSPRSPVAREPSRVGRRVGDARFVVYPYKRPQDHKRDSDTEQ